MPNATPFVRIQRVPTDDAAGGGLLRNSPRVGAHACRQDGSLERASRSSTRAYVRESDRCRRTFPCGETSLVSCVPPLHASLY